MGSPSSIITSPEQLARTLPLRRAAYRMGRLATREQILEIGAGNGLVAAEMASRTGRKVMALDKVSLSPEMPDVVRVTGLAEALPFSSCSFDAVAFHFVLLWLRNPVAALTEALRVLSPDGVLLLLAEPDLTLRRDEPDTGLGRLISETVAKHGGHPDAGSRISEWLTAAGFRPNLQTTGAEWIYVRDPGETLKEVRFLLEAKTVSDGDAEQLSHLERSSVLTGNRRVLLPVTFGIASRTKGY